MKQLSNETVAELVKTVPFAIVATRKHTAKMLAIHHQSDSRESRL